ncbi:MAG: LptF/LptG family permease [Candidatus Kapaibacterium sp.]|jgi:lipopolysaccharide export system permease protein
MNKINRYVLRAAFPPFCFGVATVIFLFLMQFLMKMLPNLIGKGLENIVILQLILYNVSWMLVLAVPIGVLFASLVAFGNLSASHEITIVKASGGSLIRMMRPMILVGTILFILMFYYNDDILPETNYKAKTLTFDIQRKKTTLAIEEGQFSNEIDGYTILAREIDTTNNILKSVTIYDNKQANLNRTISAEECKINFSNDMSKIIFDLKNGEVHINRHDNLNDYRIAYFKEYKVINNATGFDFDRTSDNSLSRGDREMHIADMQKLVDELQERKAVHQEKLKQNLNSHLDYMLGTTSAPQKENELLTSKINIDENEIYTISSNQFPQNIQNDHRNMQLTQQQISAYEVEIYKKYAIPFACLVFVFVGCPLGIKTKGGNFGISAAITLAFYILYWACLIGGEKLADRGMVSPMFSMWLGNIVLGIAGIIMTIKEN